MSGVFERWFRVPSSSMSEGTINSGTLLAYEELGLGLQGFWAVNIEGSGSMFCCAVSTLESGLVSKTLHALCRRK